MLRPTTDRVRETLFNWLQGTLTGCRVLDLCAGTGALGLEAWSRGASAATFIESDHTLAADLQATILAWKVPEAKVMVGSIYKLVPLLTEQYDVVFCDPPFHHTDYQALIRMLDTSLACALAHWIYLEAPRELMLNVPDTWQVHRTLSYGQVQGILYKIERSAT